MSLWDRAAVLGLHDSQRCRAPHHPSDHQRYGETLMTDTATVKLAPGPEAVGAARRVVAEVVNGHVDDECLDTLRLLVSEVVTNSVRHSGAREALELSLCLNGEVLVAVTDRGSGFTPRARAGAADDVGGWGLHLVERLSSHWGVAREGFTRVWFVVPVNEGVAA